MATTADGWPYVESTDHPLEYPALSQQLANLLESRWDTYEASGVLVPLAPWAGIGELACTRAGGVVTVEGLLKHTSGLTLAPGTAYQVGTLPVGFRPITDRATTCALFTGTQYVAPGTLDIKANGTLRVYVAASTVLAANTGIVAYLATYRGA